MNTDTRMTLVDAAQQALRVLASVMGGGAVFMASYRGDQMKVEHVLSQHPGLVTEGASISLVQAPCWRVNRPGSSLVIHDSNLASVDGLHSLSTAIRSCLVVPIACPDGEAWG
ncbi:MAG TPA: GAF domain-containing protein, partial [Candidatus Sulfotelmatobacter sp.]|nr:GAF domain-containing protein [Candidatus Sulfotelmatobacter sp.]